VRVRVRGRGRGRGRVKPAVALLKAGRARHLARGEAVAGEHDVAAGPLRGGQALPFELRQPELVAARRHALVHAVGAKA